MAERHTALLDIPRLVAAEGVRVVELSGWETWKPDYFWTDPNGNHYRYKGKPNGAIWHHTATDEYTPHVTANGKTKANLYIGLSVNGSERLYSQKAYWDIGVPTVAFACAGPANYGNGAGYKKVLTDYVARDREVPGPLRSWYSGDDNYYANRYFTGCEIVDDGDGSALHPGVWEAAVVVHSVMTDHFGWDSARNIGHEDSTRRKVDPKFHGNGYTMGYARDDVAAWLTQPEDDPMAGFYPTKGDTDDRDQRRFFVERIQAMVAILNGGNPTFGNRSLIEAAGMTLGTYDDRTAVLVGQFAGTSGGGVGPTEERRIIEQLAAGAHNHPQYAVGGHTHQGYSVVTHGHPFTGTTDGADS
jgi:hypothetical protein